MNYAYPAYSNGEPIKVDDYFRTADGRTIIREIRIRSGVGIEDYNEVSLYSWYNRLLWQGRNGTLDYNDSYGEIINDLDSFLDNYHSEHDYASEDAQIMMEEILGRLKRLKDFKQYEYL